MRSVKVVTAIAVAAAAILAALTVARLLQPSPTGGAAPQPNAQPQVPRFTEVARAAGITHSYQGGFEYFVGGGVAAFDCNDDRLVDLYFAGGTSPAALFVNRSTRGGSLAFERVSSPATDMVAVIGAYPLDIDSDGVPDLAVLRRGGNQLLRGLGGCQFEPANERWTFDGGVAWSTAFSARWDAGASWPTIAIGNYVDEASEDVNRLCFDNALYRPAPTGSAFEAPTPLSPGWCSLSMLFSDWDRSGRRDLRVSNDRHYYRETGDGAEQLWRIETPTDPRLYTEADGWRRLRVWGMGIASHDVTADGYPDYYLTSQSDNKLQVLAEGPATPAYEDIALRRGAIATHPYEGDTNMSSTGWHDQFEDVNNDGLIDLFVAKGNVDAMPDYAARDPSNLLIGQPDGTFREGAPAAGIVSFARARGGALVDLNLDGLLDIVVVNRIENVAVYQNVGSGNQDPPAVMGNWLAVSVEQLGANRDAIGAWIEVRTADRTQLREVTVGGGHVSGQLGPHHFGLGAATTADVRVTWSDGEVGPWLPAGANRSVSVERGATHVAVDQ